MDIKRIINEGEGETIEFKTSFDRESVETVVAFANTKGGIIIIGVDDKGKIGGISVGVNTLNQWVNYITQAVEPKVVVKAEKVFIDGNTIGLLRINESILKPVSVRGKYFKRVNSSNRQMSWEDITSLAFLLDKILLI